MKPVDMQVVGGGQSGDCLNAAIASVLELEIESLPRIGKVREDQWSEILGVAVRTLGYRLVEFSNEPAVNPPGYAIALGLSPRVVEDHLHACVALFGQVVHDPHPSREGLTRITYWLMLVPFARSPQQTSQLAHDIPL